MDALIGRVDDQVADPAGTPDPGGSSDPFATSQMSASRDVCWWNTKDVQIVSDPDG